ncbi:MAG: YraN family protein [Dehalococcoidia bacterium]|nr:YraN family protein [Dehalococcoidia bacterium]
MTTPPRRAKASQSPHAEKPPPPQGGRVRERVKSPARGLNLPPGPGKAGEAAADAHVRSLGYKILARNYRTSQGEVDIVALDGDTIAFIEVKTRRASGLAFGAPEESLTRAKQARLIAAAQSYLAASSLSDADWRIDLVAVELDRAGRVTRAELFKGAVGG